MVKMWKPEGMDRLKRWRTDQATAGKERWKWEKDRGIESKAVFLKLGVLVQCMYCHSRQSRTSKLHRGADRFIDAFANAGIGVLIRLILQVDYRGKCCIASGTSRWR